MKKILIATGNQGKLKEYKEFFTDIDVEFVSLDELGIASDSPETGNTLEENARQKAEYYGKKAEMITLADDTGFFVKAMNGEPGIHASRYGSTPEERREKILSRLKTTPKDERQAYFKLVIALYEPKTGEVHFFTGQVDGFVAQEVKDGGNGFDYDLLFYYPPSNKIFSEMTSEEKGEVSHRGKAFRKLKTYLNTNK